MNLSDTQKRAVFKTLASKSYYQTGVEFGLDKHYESRPKVASAVQKIYVEVLGDPNKFAVSQDMIELVEQGLKSRKGGGGMQISKFDEKELEELDERKLI